MGKQHIIELNGKRYDALTGRMVTEQPDASPAAHKSPAKSAPAVSMDGIAHRPAHSKMPSHHRPIQKSQTLMRTTVKRPHEHKVHAVATIVHQQSPASAATHNHHPTTSDQKTVSQSPLISKFRSGVPASEPMPEPEPTTRPQHRMTEANLAKAATQAAPVTVNPLHQAVANATSHQQPKIKREKAHRRLANKLNIRPRVMSGGALLSAIVLLAGFFAYQNAPNLRMRLAAQRAGVRGNLPAYQPPGFRLDNISHKPGEINISYKSNSDNRNFAVTQVASAWNSETLRDKLKASPETSDPVEVPDKGKTLFIYSDSNITWVDGGIWYKVEGASELNSDQLLRLANSL